jgi:predicted RNA-binding Zn-ribbon protein involved in translation (DUF1610 family)
MAKKTKDKPELIEIELDPILPLPAGTEIPSVRQGEGKEILANNETHVAVELTYRAFYVMWEHAEAIAKAQYPKYVGGPLDNAAQTALEACKAFREANVGIEFPNLSEAEAQKIRARAAKRAAKEAAENAAKMAKARASKKGKGTSIDEAIIDEGVVDKDNACPSCGSNVTKLKKKDSKSGSKLWKCPDCAHRWPRNGDGEAPERPSERPRRRERTNDAPKAKNGAQKSTQTPGKKTKKAKK